MMPIRPLNRSRSEERDRISQFFLYLAVEPGINKLWRCRFRRSESEQKKMAETVEIQCINKTNRETDGEEPNNLLNLPECP
jgi:hypothetical protein